MVKRGIKVRPIKAFSMLYTAALYETDRGLQFDHGSLQQGQAVSWLKKPFNYLCIKAATWSWGAVCRGWQILSSYFYQKKKTVSEHKVQSKWQVNVLK